MQKLLWILCLFCAVPLWADVIYDQSLVSYWKFDEVSGTVVDSAGQRDGTIHGSITQGVAGRFGHAVSIDAADSYIETGPANSISPATIETWVNLRSYENVGGSNTYNAILQINTTYQGNWSDTAFYLLNGRLCPYTSGIGQTSIALNTWTHVAMVNDGAHTKLYINGVLDATVVTGSVWNDGWSFMRIGAGYINDHEGLNGSLDDLAIFNRALSAEEIQGHATFGLEQYSINAVPEPATFMLCLFAGFLLFFKRK